MVTQLEIPGATVDPEPVIVQEPVFTPPESEPEVDSAAELQKLREQNASLKGELSGLRETRVAPPASTVTVPEPMETVDGVEAAFVKGEITDSQRIRLLSRIEVREQTAQEDASRRQQDTARKTNEKLAGYVEKYPALKDRSSPLLQKVSDELRTMAESGLDPQDVRMQVLAVEKVIARATTTQDPEEFNRRRIPVGGGGGASGNDGLAPRKPQENQKGKDLFKNLTSEAQAFYKDYHVGDMEKVYRTLGFADEGILRRSGRLVR